MMLIPAQFEQRYLAGMTALLAGTEAFQALLTDKDVCAYRLAADGTLIAASPALLELLGYRSLPELRAGELNKAGFDAAYTEAIFAQHQGELLDAETEWRQADGSLLAVRESARAVYSASGQPLHYDGVLAPLADESLPGEGHGVSLLASKPEGVMGGGGAAGRKAMIVRANQGGHMPQSSEPLALLQYISVVWRWLWLILLYMVIAGGAAYAYSIQATPIYQASASLLINQARTGNSSTDYNALLTGERLAQTYAELMRKRPVLETVIGRQWAAIAFGWRLWSRVLVDAVAAVAWLAAARWRW